MADRRVQVVALVVVIAAVVFGGWGLYQVSRLGGFQGEHLGTSSAASTALLHADLQDSRSSSRLVSPSGAFAIAYLKFLSQMVAGTSVTIARVSRPGM